MENYANPNCTLCFDKKIDDIKHALIKCLWTKDTIQTSFTSLHPDQIWAKHICPTKLLFGVETKSPNNLILRLRFRIPHTIKNSSHTGGDAVADVS